MILGSSSTLVPRKGLEPLAIGLKARCSTNWANAVEFVFRERTNSLRRMGFEPMRITPTDLETVSLTTRTSSLLGVFRENYQTLYAQRESNTRIYIGSVAFYHWIMSVLCRLHLLIGNYQRLLLGALGGSDDNQVLFGKKNQTWYRYRESNSGQGCERALC